jgi:hypothetical protein
MKKIKLLLVSMLSLMAWTNVMAQTEAEIDAANAAITDDGVYRIYTLFNGSTTGTTKYYLKADGYLSDLKEDAKLFTFARAAGGSYAAGKGYKLNKFTNGGDGDNNITSDAQKHIIVSSGNNRDDFEGQVFFLNGEGKYAIRSTNSNSAQWAAGAFWTVVSDNDEDGLPNATYSMEESPYIWVLEGPLTPIKVTYKLVESDGTTQVSSTTVDQAVGDEIYSHLPGTGVVYNGFFHEKFYYDYEVSGTIGDTDCTITITRTEKPGVVKDLSDLSNDKAYNIGCDRGAMIAYKGSMVNTALKDPTANAQPYGKFALLNYEGNYYIYSVDENKFVKNDASVALDLTEVGFSVEDAIVMNVTTAPYFLYKFNTTDKCLNTNGNKPLGYVINGWGDSYGSADPGNQYYMVEAGDFDPTAALAELEAYYHPKNFVTYVVKDEWGNTVFTSDPQPAKAGAKITTLIDEFKRPFYTYNEVDVTISELETTVEFTATWAGPIAIANDYESIHWQNLYLNRSKKWYLSNTETAPSLAENLSLENRTKDINQWGFVGNGYTGLKIYNKAAGSSKTLSGESSIVMAEGDYLWTKLTENKKGILFGKSNGDYINQAGGDGNTGLGFWGSATDDGSTFFVAEVPVDVYYDVKYNSETVASVKVLQTPGDDLSMPVQLKNGYVSYSELDGKVTEADQHVTVTATWDLNDLPFELASDFASANWQNLAMRGTWYVTSANKADDGALKTVNANAMGLVEDDYKWAFIGTDPYHIMLVNKAMGEDYVFVHTTNSNQGIPTFAKPADVENESDLYWNIRKSESSIENAFMLSVNGTNLSINQYGGAGGSVKFWDSANNYGDAGSAFTIFDVPTNFAEFTEAIETALKATGYFAYNDETRALWKDEYKTDCPYDTYVELQEAIDDMDNIVWPETGYYTLKNKMYNTYMGIDPSDANLYGNYAVSNTAKQVVKLTKVGDGVYTITLWDKFAPATVAQSAQVTAANAAGTYTVVIPAPGYAAFMADTEAQYSALHCAAGGSIVGWVANADASMWVAEDATSITIPVGETKYATAYVPFAVTPSGAITAYTGTINGNFLTLTEVEGTIPAKTAVVLNAEVAADYIFDIADDVDPIEDNDLLGSDGTVKGGAGIYALAKPEAEVGFFAVGESVTIPTGKAYLSTAAGVKGYLFNFNGATAIENINVNDNLNEGVIYNIAGQRLSKMQKGINIVNGKKMLK